MFQNTLTIMNSDDDELPDIPYTPLHSIPGTSGGSSNCSKSSQREKEKLRKRVWRANQSEEKKDATKQVDRLRKSTPEAKAKRTTPEAKAKRSTPEAKAKRSTPEALEANRQRVARFRSKKKQSNNAGDARQCIQVMTGELKVQLLEETNDSIGLMIHECQHCGALKFKDEPPTTCCSNGKIVLTPFPRPPEHLMKLWSDNNIKGRLLREHSRHINNAVCLSSIQVQEKRFQGFTPSVIFQGKIIHRLGPISHREGETPRFAQLYVLDPQMEFTQRIENLHLPVTTTKPQQAIIKQLVHEIQGVIHEFNPFVKDFKQILELPADEIAMGKVVISAKGPNNEHRRRYNTQTNLKEVRIVTNSEPHDLVVHLRGGGLQTIHDMNPNGMPLHFTLLFPLGTHGWDPQVLHTEGNRRVTTREFFTFHMNARSEEKNNGNGNYIHKGGKLYQEWLCMAWCSVEDQRLKYQRQNQKALRADSYRSVKEVVEERMRELAPRQDALYPDDHQRPATIGRMILSSSFQGSPRWYNSKFQDAMAIVREYHKPDLFITMTCNPHWPEIQRELAEGQSPQDRPDVVARSFKKRKDQFIRDIVYGKKFGTVVAYMWVIEFQKRGLPHLHLLLILENGDRMLTPELVDNMVVAEMPNDASTVSNAASRAQVKKLEEIVLTNMVHGPCGVHNPSSPCMVNGKCSKGYPKEYVKETVVDPDSYYALYRRRSPQDGGREFTVKGKTLDNRWIVPYNAYFSLRYNCHINVEACASVKAARYLFKYITKGNDRALVLIEVEGQRNEIEEYQDLRSVGSSEATWHLLCFPITDKFPVVIALRVHLEDQQQIVFDPDQEMEALENQRQTELTAFFAFNSQCLSNGESLDDLPRYTDIEFN